jgi:hypothetical protein
VAYLVFDIISAPLNEEKITELQNYPSASTGDGSEVPVVGSNSIVKVINYCGDCDGDDLVEIHEIQSAVNMHLRLNEILGCVDLNYDNAVTIDEVQLAINGYLNSLPNPPTYLNITQFSAPAASARPTAQPVVTLGSVSGKSGSLISIPVSLKTGTQNISSLSMDIVFDPNILESPLVAVGAAAEAAGKTAGSNLLENGAFRVALAGLNANVFQDGVIANLTFRIKSGVTAKQTVLAVQPSGSTPEALPLAISGGSGIVKISTRK